MLELQQTARVVGEPLVPTDNEQFRLSVHRHLSGEEVGSLLDFSYAPHGGKEGRKSMSGDGRWVALTKHRPYYLSAQDKAALLEDLPNIIAAKVVPPGLSMLDVAPGDSQALLNKSSIVADAFDIADYVALEISPEFADAAREVFGQRLGNLNVRVFEVDAFKEAQLPICKRALIYCSGTTAGGLRGPVPSGPPIEQLSEMISALASHADEAYVIFSYANNIDNPAQLLRAYNNEPSHDFQRNVLFRVADELDTQNFDPRLFEGISTLHHDSGYVSHHLIPTAAQTFTLDGIKYRVGPGIPIGSTGDDRIHIGNSTQITESWLTQAAKLSGAEVIWRSQSERPVKHVVLHKPAANNNAYSHLRAV